ncbi:NUDIX domain-containing protein [Saccharothrix syringae]|uniref:NUDIX domain-containing protein n=1 Tax=Saccharothrix syringae TaxID=103733 RepID=A0A5Q0GX03_SACSY|nr:NUDIX domain-containing protein [Saccharothrix syringae]QFZ18636.1 NUDIX domain-containing protein [Saccharothrix syringae]
MEMIDFVDADDRVVGRGQRGGARDAGLHYRVAATVVLSADRVLVYRRPGTAGVYPGHHDVLVGGTVRSGESYRQAAERELAEEFGIRPVLREAVRERRESPIGPCHLAVYLAEARGRLRPDPAEVDHHELLSVAEVLARPPRPFVAVGLAVLRRLFREHPDAFRREPLP